MINTRTYAYAERAPTRQAASVCLRTHSVLGRVHVDAPEMLLG